MGLPYELYRGSRNFVPPIYRDELDYFDRARNPAFDVARVRLLLAEQDGRAVGRLCASVNPLEEEKLGQRRGRFGWLECVEDAGVARALLDETRGWLAGAGCTEMTGPQGFTDLDPEGLLIEGFDRPPTISGSFNFPYYREFLEGYGLKKDADYVEFRSEVPEEELPLFERMRQRYAGEDEYTVVTCRNRKELRARIGEIWTLLEEAFAPLYGVVPLTAEQTEYYTRKYFDFLDPDFVKLTYDRQERLVAFFIGMPNLSRAFQRAGGRLLPFGFLHILRAYRRPETVDYLLAAIKPGEAAAAIRVVTFLAMYDTLRRRGVRYTETNRELESNTAVNQLWSRFHTVYTRRSRVYRMALR